MSYVRPHCHCFPLEDYIWWVSSRHGEKQCRWCCAACGGQYDWRPPSRILVIQDSTDHREEKMLSGSCGTTRNLRQLDQRAEALDKPQKDGDSSVGKIVTNFGRAQEIHCSGQSRSSDSWRSAPRNKVQERGKAKVHGRLPGSCDPGRRG